MITAQQHNRAAELLMDLHRQDITNSLYHGKVVSDEEIYALRMSEQLASYVPDASFELKIAANAHHLKRWEIKRSDFPMDKQGYFQWRRNVAKHQLALTADVLIKAGISDEDCEMVISILKKENRKSYNLAQVLEDVGCLVFVEHYLEAFAGPHDDEKVIDIIRKTMLKMSGRALKEAAALPVSDKVKGWIAEAVKLLPAQ